MEKKMDEKEIEEFREWKRKRHQTELEHAFIELEDLMRDMKDYTIVMPKRSFKLVVRALILLKEEVCSKK